MFTFVIDIHGNLANFEVTEPFLYPLKDEMCLVELSENSYTAVKEAGEIVHRFLERRPVSSWQVVFLVDLSLRDRNPLIGSLTYYLYAVKENFVKPLTRDNLVPREIVILSVDGVERGQKGKPRDPELAVRWELDTHGYRSESIDEDITFGIKEIKDLDALWDKKLDIRNEQFGRGIEGLTPKLKNELEVRRDKLEKGMAQFLEKKKKQLETSQSPDNLARQLMAEAYENIGSGFLERVEQILKHPDSADVLENFLPSEILKDVIKSNISIHSDYFSSKFMLLRFPFPRGQQQDFQKNILKLTFLLIAIVENDIGSLFKMGESHETEIMMDEPGTAAFSKLLYDYQRCLKIKTEELRHEVNDPESVSLNFQVYNAQPCSEEIRGKKMDEVKFRFFLDHDAVTHLKSWMGSVLGAVAGTDEEFHEKIGTCIEQTYRIKPPDRQEDVSNIRDKTRVLKKEYLTQLKKLPPEDLQSPRDKDFDSFMQEKEWELKNQLSHRPTRNQFLLISAGALLILYLSIYFTMETLGHLIWGAVSLAAALMAGILCRKDFFENISRLVGQIKDKTEGIILRIRNKFNGKKIYLKELFNVNIARKNYMTAEKAWEEERNSKILLNFHLKEMENHLFKADKLCELYPLEDKIYEGVTRKEFCDLEIEKPVVLNEIYSPASFKKTLSKHEYRIGVNEAFNTRRSSHLFAVDKIHFKKDRIFP